MTSHRGAIADALEHLTALAALAADAIHQVTTWLTQILPDPPPDVDPSPHFTCPRCHRDTWHPEDIKYRYCPCCGGPGLPKDCPHR